MSASVTPPPPLRVTADKPQTAARVGRPAWRQHLVDVERGAVSGFRGRSGLYVYLFCVSVVFVAGTALEISAESWTALVLAATIVLAAEMFQHALETALEAVAEQPNRRRERALHAGAAAVFVTISGAAVTVAIVFGSRLISVLSGPG